MEFWLRLRALKTINFYFRKVIEKIKDKLKRFMQRIMKKNKTWNIRRLVDETIIPSTQQPSVLYWRLSDFLSTDHQILTALFFWTEMPLHLQDASDLSFKDLCCFFLLFWHFAVSWVTHDFYGALANKIQVRSSTPISKN